MTDRSISPLGSSPASEFAPSQEGAPTPGKIGFIGLGHMGTAMATNLANTAHRVTAYVRRPDQMGALIGLGLRPTLEFANLFDCEVVISMLPDDTAVRDVVFGREDAGVKGLASGLKRGAIHLSMSTISTSASAFLAAEQARRGQQAAAKKLGSLVEFTNSIGMKFTLIPPGDFTMGGAETVSETGMVVVVGEPLGVLTVTVPSQLPVARLVSSRR